METTNRMNIVLQFETPDETDTDEGFESRVIGTVLDALALEGAEPLDIAVVAV